ncbi:MAG: 50S ribosomal protein L7ae [Lachnospiraceae bacterium]|jgi:ribosomal protein L7Ae-like RNA K-turn-binding protein|nr:50S ribosomal protein L7ae [Lachnospiraceae bacterium]MCI9099642.1 50S ribosomal protein L7ae [Lachnospiraceae bacterium]MCI9358668.1 50S ribosomal protein L7ae [Lachnospiraceae bacterium]
MKALKGSGRRLKKNKVLSLAGLAARAGKIASGEFPVEKAVKAGKGHLVVVAADASDNTKKKFSNTCKYYQVPILFMETKEELGRAVGREFRASIAVLDAGFAEAMLKEVSQQQKKEECVCQK